MKLINRLLISMLILASLLGQPAPAVRAETTLSGGSALAPQALVWADSAYQYSSVVNCFSIIQGLPYSEPGMGVKVGYQTDLTQGTPAPNQVYYIHVVVASMGNPCSGQRAYIDVQLPASTLPVISGANPVYCFANGAPFTAPSCPQVLQASSINPGAYVIPSQDFAHAQLWGIVQGTILEFAIPVQSSIPLGGSTLMANIWVLDGNSSPWLRPALGVYVFSHTPAVFYPAISTGSITAHTAISTANIYAFGATGTVYFDLGLTSGYGMGPDIAQITTPGSGWTVTSDWTGLGFTLAADTLYHWRVRFVSGATTYYGDDQTFRTLTDGLVTVGSGSPGSCTTGTLDAAFASAGLKEISFNCGSAPVTIGLSGTKTIYSSLTINGGNLVTIQGSGSFGLFDVAGGAALTFNNLTLAGGGGTGCGGAVHVQPAASASFNLVHLTNNHSAYGGAICVEATGGAGLNRSLLNANSAGADGGAVYNVGNFDSWWSDISGNSASGEGGGIWSSGSTFLTYSLISGNSLPTRNLTGNRGGGIFNSGDATITNTTISGNLASNGGGLANINGSMALTEVTIADNTADRAIKTMLQIPSAGGLLSTTLVTATLRNTLLARNSPGNCGTLVEYLNFTSGGNNLSSDGRCNLTAPDDLSNVDPLLGPLANNGGLTRTMSLAPGSPAIDAGSNLYCGFYDQRGFIGPSVPGDTVQRQVNGRGLPGPAQCDIGAFEFRPEIFLPWVTK